MNKMQKLGLIGLLSSATLAIGAEKDVLNNWKKVVSTNDFAKTLVSVRTLQDEWPAIHSVKHAINKDKKSALTQTGYRDVARTFLLGLERYEKVLREMPPEAFCEGADALLDARGHFLKNPGYINYFIADAINRVVFINLGERLAKIGEVPMCYDKIVERLAEFRCDWSLFFEITNRELGANQFSAAKIQAMPLKEKAEAIGKMVGQEQSFFWFAPDAHNLYGLRLLEKRSLPPLLTRLASADHDIGGLLPALLSYRRKAVHFSPTDSFQQIQSVLGKESRMPPTMYNGDQPFTAYLANDALRAVCSEKWRMTLYFSDPPGLTKEIIENAEREEVEREAEREAKQAK